MRWSLLLLALALAGCADAPTATDTTSGYAPLLSSPIRGLSAEEVASIEQGAGMRLALPAELNGYPGPKHMLELADGLGLDAGQRAATQDLYDRTNAAARAAGEVLLEKWAALDQAFRSGNLTEARLHALVAEVDAAQAEVRYVHLRAHLEARGLLTEQQLARYDELRGYAAGHGDGGHTGHGH